MRKLGKISLMIVLLLIFISSCSYEKEETSYSTTQSETYSQTQKYNDYTYKTYTSAFRNKYGTRTTKCAHSGCTDFIATSGDTNCCPQHSNRCYECNCYIDEDAAWCLSCIEDALK